ncbi:lysine-rich arabinogalactan protein 17-like [Herpailurus yagouaroundi]|uniref:Uncharacterized protein LOC113595065 n=1 Tax=Acinonyx jubatus TaxID=32536 RepID=A0A6J1Y3Z3_ACIJB|nr:uncharacterized protein LOC113595065 [Acinonyx jubatus]XP_040330608.1 lysine-rich arabinogalactan protein 17-like [Puma yagouaroundi]
MSDGDNRCSAESQASRESPSLARQARGGQSLTLETVLLALHQPSEVTPQPASCCLVKPEVTSTSRNPPVPDADFPPKGRREETVRKQATVAPEPSPRLHTTRPPRLAARSSLPRRPSSATTGHSRNRPPAPLAGLLRPPAPPPEATSPAPPHPPLPGGRFRSRVRACAPAAATAAVAARGSVRRETWCCFLGVKVLSNFRFLILSPGF